MKLEVFDYKEEYGPINWPEGFEKELGGKPLEEQHRCYAWSKLSAHVSMIPYKEVEDDIRKEPWKREYMEPIEERIIVKDGLIVGTVVKQCVGFLDNGQCKFEYIYVLPYQSYCYDYESDNNGAGYKDRCWYKHLICLPADHKLWD